MVQLRSSTYPGLRVHVGDISVKFVDGVAEVSEAVARAVLDAGLPGVHAVEAAGVPAPGAGVVDAQARKPGRPKKTG